MKKVLVFLAAVIFVGISVVPSGADILTFEDLSGQGSMYSPYHIISSWTDGWSHYDWDQPPYTPHSGSQRLYIDVQYSASDGGWTFSEVVKFNGAWFAGTSDNTIQMDLYSGGSVVHSTGTLALTDTPQFLNTGYSGLVNAVVIHSPGIGYWVMDDLTYNANNVPAPAAILLFGSGLIGLAGFAIRRQLIR